MNDPTLIADLIRAGIDPDLVQRVVDAVTRHVTRRDAVTPAVTQEAMRARKYRQNLKQKQEAAKANDVATVLSTERDASRDGVTECCNLLTSLSLLTDSQVSTEENKKEDRTVIVEGRKSTSRGTRLSPDWTVAVVSLDLGAKLGMKLSDIEFAADEFRDYWTAIPGARGLKLNWDKTFNNRLRAIADRRRPKNGQNNVIDAADRLVERMRSLRSGAGETDVRLLPSNRGGRS